MAPPFEKMKDTNGVGTDPYMSLDMWRRAVLRSLQGRQFPTSTVKNATLLAYFFWNDDRIETDFYAVECAFLCAYKNWGLLPSVLVVNRTTKKICDFSDRYGIQLQIEPHSLTKGVPSMNIDCIRNLHRRFDTEYVVVIQSDGLPVNPGLERFIGKYDYVGAPWPGKKSWRNCYTYPKFSVGNGGFCIRSKRICEQASAAYNAFWRCLPYSLLVGDDIFYCKTMPFISRKWRNNFRYADIPEALKFSIEHLSESMELLSPPMGFHSEFGFRNYVKLFGIPMQKDLKTS